MTNKGFQLLSTSWSMSQKVVLVSIIALLWKAQVSTLLKTPVSGKGTFCKKSSSLRAKELSLRPEDALSSPRMITLSWERTTPPWKSNFQKEWWTDLFQHLIRQFPNRQPAVCFQRLYPWHLTAFEKFSTLFRSFLHFWEILSPSEISLRNFVP